MLPLTLKNTKLSFNDSTNISSLLIFSSTCEREEVKDWKTGFLGDKPSPYEFFSQQRYAGKGLECEESKAG